MVNSYLLVNPYIQGKFKSKIKAKNSMEAANLFYNKLSELFNNSVPQLNFSIAKGKDQNGKLYHFQVREKREANEVNYAIKVLDDINDNHIDDFRQKLENFQVKFESQMGGNKKLKKKSSKKSSRKKSSRKDDSDSLSDSDFETENVYKRVRTYLPIDQPIYYWWYDPYVYRFDSVYIPTFYSYVTPYIELNLRY